MLSALHGFGCNLDRRPILRSVADCIISFGDGIGIIGDALKLRRGMLFDGDVSIIKFGDNLFDDRGFALIVGGVGVRDAGQNQNA